MLPNDPTAPQPADGAPSHPEPVAASVVDHAAHAPRRGRAALGLALGLAAGLGLAEAGFRARDGNAFPLVNVYARDDQRGVRLRPGSATVVGRRGERVTHVRVNADGYRGADFPPPDPGEVLVVGDSLSFGLGVEEDEALPARLRAALPAGDGKPVQVLDASVPTYGPPEYLVTMEQVLARRTPRAVVIVVNPLNDFAEVDQPNTARHTAVDGWAARVGEGRAPAASSPIREEAIRRSHLLFALWRWQRTREAAAEGLPPEGGLEALFAAAADQGRARRLEADRARSEEERTADRAAAEAEVAAARAHVVDLVRSYAFVVAYSGVAEREWRAYLRHDGEPEDEVFTLSYGGCAPPPRINGRYQYDYRARFTAARIRDDVEGLLRDLTASRSARPGAAEEVTQAFARREAAIARLAELSGARPAPAVPRPPLPIAPFVARAVAVAGEHRTKLAVVAVPLDAQVSEEARARRGIGAEDVGSLDRLMETVAAGATEAGAIGIDATPALRAAGPAAFLPDGHLAPAGHEALARAVAAALPAATP